MIASIIIPAKNEENNIGRCLEAVFRQSADFPFEVLVIDSGSQDRTMEIVREYPARLLQITPAEFHHARTRNLGGRVSSGKYLVFLSSDAFPADKGWLSALVRNFREPAIAAVYGRQLPKADATPERAFFMHHRYGTQRLVKTANSNGAGKYLLYQFSNVNSAVRRDVWEQTPFPEDINAYEDFSFAVQIVRQGRAIVYEPEATVLHSHNYSLMKSFQQYFDNGVVYKRRKIWDGQQKNRMRSDGLRYLWNETKYLVERGAGHRLPYVLCYEGARYLGIVFGRQESLLPDAFKKRASSHRLFG
jgi:glycosyltransferase involved in cell wall biosynthesis